MIKRKKIWISIISLTLVLCSLYAAEYTFSDLNASMIANNPELMGLKEEYARSQLDIKDAWAGLGPTIDLQVTGTYMLKSPVEAVYLNADDIINSIHWPSGLKPATGNQYIKVYDGMENTLYNFQLSLMQPIFTWGKIGNAIILYKQIGEIKKLQVESKQQQLETELKTRLITLTYLQKINQIIEEEKQYISRLVEVSENAEKSGVLLHQDVVDARIQAKELEIAQQDLQEQLNNQLLELIRSTAIEDLTCDNIDFQFDEEEIEKILSEDRDVLLTKALSEDQLSIKMLSELKKVNEIAVKIAKGYENWKPDIALQTTVGYGGSRFPFVEPNWLRKDDYTLNISVGIKSTIWDGGKKVRDVSRKISETKTADINQLDAKATIKKTFNEQWNTAEVCSMKMEYQDLKIEACDSKIEQKETVFKTGYGSETDVLNAKIDRCNQLIEKQKQALSRAAACMIISNLCN